MSYFTYNRELADLICEQLALGKTLRSVCRSDDMPSRESVRLWVLRDEDGFAKRYEDARMLGYEVMEEQVLDIGDEVGADMASIQKARLQVDSRKWILAKSLPKRYADRTILAGDAESPLEIRPPIDQFVSEFMTKRTIGTDGS